MSDAAVAPLELERWFVSCRRPWRCDLSASAAAAPTLAALLALAAPDERAAFHEASLDYGPPDGCSELRELIASRHTGTSPTDVVVTAGATQALHLAITCLLDPGDEIVVQWPTYPAIAGIAETHGAVVRLWQTDDAARPDLRTLEHLLTPRTRVVAITQPNNPTGTLFCDGDLVALLALADAAGARVVSDEVYRDLALTPCRPASAVERSSSAVSIGDVSKPFGLGGLRVGWAITRDAAVRARLAARRDYATLSPPVPSDALARIALKHAGELLRSPIANARANLTALTRLAAEHELGLVPPRAGLTAFPRVGDAEALQRRLADDGVLVVPGAFFGRPAHVRIWLGGAPDAFARALVRMDGHLADV